MSRRSERLEKINKPDSVDGPELQSTRSRIKRQENVGKRSTSARVKRRRALSSASDSEIEENPLFVQVPAIEEAGENSEPDQQDTAEVDPLESFGKQEEFEKEDSAEWDPSYDKDSPLKDVSDILDLTITRVSDQVEKDRSLSVAINTAPEDFAIDQFEELRESGLPVPSVLNVHGLATVLESSEGEDSKEEEELLQRLEKLRSSSMDDAQFKQKVKDLRTQELMIEVMLQEFTADDVTYEDRESYKDKLVRIGEKYSKWRDECTSLIAELDPNENVDQGRIASVKSNRDDVVRQVADHAKAVKMKVVEVVRAEADHVANAPAVQPVQALLPPNGDKKKDLANKMKRKAARMETSAKDLIRKVNELPEPSSMMERDLRKEITVEFPERDKKCKEISENVYDILDNLSTVDEELNLRDVPAENKLNNLVVEMNQAVEERKVLVRSLDESLGLCTEYPNPSKSTIPTPDIFEGKTGTNVYKFRDKIMEYIEAAQIREKDKVDTLRKYLSGEAKTRVGEHHKKLEDALQCLVDIYGNPSVIWSESKKELIKEVGDYNKDWGRLGSQQRVTAIGKCVEFLREAEMLAREYPELVNNVYSSPTFEILTEVLPFAYTDRIYDEIGNVRTTDKEKMMCIRDYLELKLQGALVAAARQTDSSVNALKARSFGGTVHENPSRDDGGGRGPGRGSYRGRGSGKVYDGARSKGNVGHDCNQDHRCKTEWGLLGCWEFYACDTVSERREYMRKRLGCWKCGDFPVRGGFTQHKCRFRNKKAVWCIGDKTCKRPAAMCEENHTPKVSAELSDWFKKNNIKTTVNLCIDATEMTFPGNQSNVFLGGITDEDVQDLQSGNKAKLMPDSELVEYFKKTLAMKGESQPKIKPYPSGQCVFLFCLIEGKTRPIQAFVDSGCNTMLSRQNVPETELVSAKLIKGPIPVSVAGGGEIMASGLWATLLPLNDGTNQVAKTLTMDTITADMNVVDLESVYDEIKSKAKGVKALQNLKVPKEVGGKVDLLIGFNLLAVHPEPVHTFPSGLTVYKSKFKPPWPGVLGCVGGPVEALQCIAGMSGNIAALANLKAMAYLTKDYKPRLDFFPDLHEKMLVDPEMKYMNLIEDAEVDNINDDDFGPEEQDSGEQSGTAIINTHTPTPGCCQCESDHSLSDNLQSRTKEEEKCNHNLETSDEEFSLTVGQDIRKFMEYQELGLDQGYKCPRCRKCRECQRGAGHERISMKQEAEQEIIKESVVLDEERNKAVVKLAFIANPVENLRPNRYSAMKRLDNVCRKYSSEPDSVKMICEKINKLHKAGHIQYWEDLSAEQKQKIECNPTSHYLCWDVGFKEGSMSTPARPVFDGSARTPGGTSLNEILAKGITTLARLVEVQLAWVVGRYALTGDVSQAYNAMLLDEDHWAYQRVLLKDDLDVDNIVREAIITSAIYGVRCVGGQLEVLCAKLADLCEDEFPDVAEFLRKFRYVDDFTKSVDNLKEVLDLIKNTENVLSMASLVVKDWAWSGKEPPEKMSPDGKSVNLAGLAWYPEVDAYRLNLDSIHFGVKRRGRYPPGTVKLQDTQQTMNDFVPEKLTRRYCARIAARVYDLRGDVAPLLLRLKNDLRGLILKQYDWDDVLDMDSRRRWVENFSLMERVRLFMFERCKIPEDAVNIKGRLWILVNAEDGCLVMVAFIFFLWYNAQ